MIERNPIMVFVTASSREEAEKIAEKLLEEKLIACANIIGPVFSTFWWQGKIDQCEEYLIIMKTRKYFFNKISERVKSLHSYSLPEIIAVSIVEGYEAYLDWLSKSLK